MSIVQSFRHPSTALPGRIRAFTDTLSLRSYVYGLIAAFVLGGAYVTFAGTGASTTAAAQTVTQTSRRTISSAVKAVGKVTFASEQELKFNQKGTVAKVAFKEGAIIKKGQVIAELDKSSVLSDVRQAQLAVAASNLQLQQMQSDKNKTFLDAQNAVKDAKNALDVAAEKLPTDVAGAQRSVTEKTAALEQAKAELAQAQITTLQGLGATAQSVLTSGEDSLDALYSVLANDMNANMRANETLVIYYRLYNDQTQKNATERSYYAAAKAIADMRATYGSSLPTLQDEKKITAALNDAHSVATAIHQLADDSYQLLQGATDDPHDFTVADIKALKTKVIAQRSDAADLISKVETAQAGLQGGVNHLASITLQQKTDAVNTAQHALADAEENLSLLQTQNPGDLQKVRDDLDSKQAALQSTTMGTDVSIKLKQNDIAQKAASLQKTQKTLQDYQLTAPFDGILTHIDYKVGDNLLDTGDTETAVLQNHDFIVVTIPLDQVDVVRVHADMPATIAFDAVPGKTFDGTIYTIDSSPLEQSGVVSYNVEIKLPTPANLTILSGMTATVNIETVRKENVLAVPNLALQHQGSRVLVRRATGESVPVETGETDGQYTEITSGLNEGDAIISVNITAAATASAGANGANVFRLGGGLGGGGGNFQRPAGGGRPGGG